MGQLSKFLMDLALASWTPSLRWSAERSISLLPLSLSAKTSFQSSQVHFDCSSPLLSSWQSSFFHWIRLWQTRNSPSLCSWIKQSCWICYNATISWALPSLRWSLSPASRSSSFLLRYNDPPRGWCFRHRIFTVRCIRGVILPVSPSGLYSFQCIVCSWGILCYGPNFRSCSSGIRFRWEVIRWHPRFPSIAISFPIFRASLVFSILDGAWILLQIHSQSSSNVLNPPSELPLLFPAILRTFQAIIYTYPPCWLSKGEGFLFFYWETPLNSKLSPIVTSSSFLSSEVERLYPLYSSFIA